MALGGGGFVGSVSAPTKAVQAGYAGATTDTGHKGSSGSFGMLSPGVPDAQLRTDFGWRSEHMMAVVSKQLIEIFYGKQPKVSYWNGCSTGGRQAQAMAQRFPDDYQGTINPISSCHAEWANQHAIYVWGFRNTCRRTSHPLRKAWSWSDVAPGSNANGEWRQIDWPLQIGSCTCRCSESLRSVGWGNRQFI
eukprot:COSAG02_NODE_3876_length_6103_cov_2.989007_9_plen_192_part_00